MSHHIYQTEALVLGSTSSGEANRYVYAFTHTLGLVGASAQGVRLLKSKLRYSLQDMNFVDLSLVRGKSGWKVVNARYLEGAQEKWGNFSEKKQVFGRILSLVKRLVHGEEKNEQLFDILKDSFVFLTQTDISAVTIGNFECLAVLRILHSLGYLPERSAFEPLLQKGGYDSDLLGQVAMIKREAVAEINKSLLETQL